MIRVRTPVARRSRRVKGAQLDQLRGTWSIFESRPSRNICICRREREYWSGARKRRGRENVEMLCDRRAQE